MHDFWYTQPPPTKLARITALEAEIARLNNEIADRERRLATSRFECATARTTITHLQAQLERAAPAGAK